MTERVNQEVDSTSPEAQELDPRYRAEADATGAGEVQRDVETVERELAAAREEAAGANDRYLRARADMENYKKRVERTYADLARSSKKDLLRRLLSVKDNLERALHYGESSQNGEGIMEGVRLTGYQLDQLLQQEGVQSIEAQGKPFDPRYEEALQSVANEDVPEHTVVQVVRPGYTYTDSASGEAEVLRPAQVIVSVRGDES